MQPPQALRRSRCPRQRRDQLDAAPGEPAMTDAAKRPTDDTTDTPMDVQDPQPDSQAHAKIHSRLAALENEYFALRTEVNKANATAERAVNCLDDLEAVVDELATPPG